MSIRVQLPEGVCCAVALSYDTDMAAGYSPDGICHGRTAPFLKEYMLKLCDTAEKFGVQLHFFQIGNGLEADQDVGYLQAILKHRHLIDNHTYTHLPLITQDVYRLDDELARTHRLIKERLGWTCTVLRGPGGYQNGLEGFEKNQQVILQNGFRWVSCQYDGTLGQRGLDDAIAAPSRHHPNAYPNGLIEIPIQGFTDRHWFDNYKCVDTEAYTAWRREHGHQPVPADWQCPWTSPNALDDWIDYNLATLDYAYEHRLLWAPVWHPYSHYLHDPRNRMLLALLEHAASKPERVRDAANMLVRR